jgi:hypothetical protein
LPPGVGRVVGRPPSSIASPCAKAGSGTGSPPRLPTSRAYAWAGPDAGLVCWQHVFSRGGRHAQPPYCVSPPVARRLGRRHRWRTGRPRTCGRRRRNLRLGHRRRCVGRTTGLRHHRRDGGRRRRCHCRGGRGLRVSHPASASRGSEARPTRAPATTTQPASPSRNGGCHDTRFRTRSARKSSPNVPRAGKSQKKSRRNCRRRSRFQTISIFLSKRASGSARTI